MTEPTPTPTPTPDAPELGYVHRPPLLVARGHLGRYPRHYGALALFLLAMVLVPTIGAPSLTELASATPGADTDAVVAPAPTSAGGPSSTSAAPARTALGALLGVDDDTLDLAIGVVAGGAAAVGGIDVPDGSDTPPSDAPPTDEPEDAGPVGQLLPPPPALPLGPVPDELKPLVAAVAPLTSTGCSALGLSGVLVAIVGTTAQGVPVGEVLPYLGPAFTACALFPGPGGDVLICDIDQAARDAGYPADVSGLAKTPNLIGTAVEVLYGIEAAIATYTGQSPGIADGIATQLGCEPDV